MSTNGKTIAAKVSRWKVMAANVREELEANPHLQGPLTQMEGVIVEFETLENRQGEIRANLQELNQQRFALLRTGEDLRGRLAAGMHLEHGFKSERLLQFGLKPRRNGRTRAAESKKKAASQQPAADSEQPGEAASSKS